jgi:hypothetical protein
MNLFEPCTSLESFDAELASATRGRIPVWVGAREDLLMGISLAEAVYDGVREPPPCANGIFLGSPPEAVMESARPLAERWHGDPGHGPGSVLLVGTYRELLGDAVQHVIERCHREGRDLYVLTGRDQRSLSWAIAKQFAAPAPGEVGVFSELDSLEPAEGVRWFGAHDMSREDLREVVLGTVWRRVLFHGNGKDDSLNLGAFTLCGLSPEGVREGHGPRCAYGAGCFKAEDKLIPARRIMAAEMVLANCFSGPLADHAMYDPKYVILLNALDGPAQTVITTLTACDAGRPENVEWLSSSGHGNAATILNRRLADINPYPAFMQIGTPAARSTPSVERTGWPLGTLGQRVHGLVDSGILPAEHPVLPQLRRLKEALLAASLRRVAESARDRDPAVREVVAAAGATDLALARRFSTHRDDPLLDFATYFGERSVAAAPVDWTTCACGRPVRRVVRRGRLPVVPDTVQDVCPRCGDVYNAVVEGVELDVSCPAVLVQGERYPVRLTVTAPEHGVVLAGLVPSPSLRVTVSPPLRRLRARAGEPVIADFTLAVAEDSPPQACFVSPFALQSLALSVGRSHVNVTTG